MALEANGTHRSALPRRRATVALRLESGRDVVTRVVDGDGDYIRVAPAPPAGVDSFIDLVWGHGGSYHRATARVIEASGGGLWLALGAASPIERRYFQRTPPPRPLRAEVRRLDRDGAVVEVITCAVHDLSVAGVGLLLERSIEEGVAVEISVLETDGRVILQRVAGEIVCVTVDGRGRIAGARFRSIWESVHALRGLLEGSPARA